MSASACLLNFYESVLGCQRLQAFNARYTILADLCHSQTFVLVPEGVSCLLHRYICLPRCDGSTSKALRSSFLFGKCFLYLRAKPYIKRIFTWPKPEFRGWFVAHHHLLLVTFFNFVRSCRRFYFIVVWCLLHRCSIENSWMDAFWFTPLYFTWI